MDPNAAVDRIVELAQELRRVGGDQSAEYLEELQEVVAGLSNWLKLGGFPPSPRMTTPRNGW